MTPFRCLSTLAAVVLGTVFIVASSHKILDPPDFARIIFNYDLLPDAIINLSAIYVPWLELLAGVALINGACRRGASLAAGLLALFFICALSYNLYRGHPTICGCFDTHAHGVLMSREEKFAKMTSEVYLDVGFVVLALLAFAGSGKKPSESLPA